MILINEKLKQHAALGISALLGGMIVLTLLLTALLWHHDWTLAHQNTEETSASDLKNTTIEMINAIPEAHLFGQSFDNDDVIPLSNLNVRVTGIVSVGSNHEGSTSKAYLSLADQPSKIFKTGDTLPDDVKIQQITPDAVILSNNGHLEKLILSRQKLIFKPRLTERYE